MSEESPYTGPSPLLRDVAASLARRPRLCERHGGEHEPEDCETCIRLHIAHRAPGRLRRVPTGDAGRDDSSWVSGWNAEQAGGGS